MEEKTGLRGLGETEGARKWNRGSNQDASTSIMREEWNNPVEGLDRRKEINRIPGVPMEREGIDPQSQMIWKGGNKRRETSVVPRGKKVHLKRTRQTRQPLEGPVVQGPFHPHRTRAGLTVG